MIKYVIKYKEENKGDGPTRSVLNEAHMTSSREGKMLVLLEV